MSLDGKPRKARTLQNCEAWFYINKRTEIAVFIRTPGQGTVCAIIPRRSLGKWIAAKGAPDA